MPTERWGRIIDATAAGFDEATEEVARAVFSGETVIFPNDTSYLIGSDPYIRPRSTASTRRKAVRTTGR